MTEDIRKWSDGRYTLMFDEHTFFVFDNEKEKRMTALQTTKKLNEQQATIEQLKSELNDCEKFRYQVFKGMEKIIEKKKNDNGGFQVWEVPPIPMGKRISFTTNNDGDGV